MGIVNLLTDLKSLEFGNDRAGDGDSGQPYITKPIDESSQYSIADKDFILRGGLKAPLDALTDIKRLTKWFFDKKNPSGLLFTIKQNLLSRVAVRTQASGVGLNEGVYTPLSTLAQAGIGFVGGHIPKQGLIPFKGVKTYTDVVKSSEDIDNSIVKIGKNRLVDLLKTKQTGIASIVEDILSYSGGPGSKLGIGKTNIKFATKNTGAPLRTGVNSGLNFKTYQVGLANTETNRDDLQTFQSLIGNPFYSPLTGNGVTTIFKTAFNPPSIEIGLNDGKDGKFGTRFKTSVYTTEIFKNKEYPLQSTDRIYDNGALTWNQDMIEGQTSPNNSTNVADPTLQDFRAPLLKKQLLEGKKSTTIMSLAPSYKPKEGQTIDGVDGSRINQTSPGLKGNIINFSKGKIIPGDGGGRVSVVDRINFQPLYKSENVLKESDIDKNDLVKFRIGAILRDGKKVYMHFRAFINNFSDAYKASWSGIKYMGRGEEFYKYGGFGRQISISFTVAAQSKPELMAQYKKLNFLASTLAPDYGSSGYMGGVLTTLTLGGWCYELPGFISSLDLSIPQESPWEIAIPATEKDADKINPISSDKTVKEMPHICNVAMSFTPIHTFRPELQKNNYTGLNGEIDNNGEIPAYGPQHYLALKNGHNNNYVPVSLKEAQTPSFSKHSTNVKQST